jgi:hypothetical protein
MPVARRRRLRAAEIHTSTGLPPGSCLASSLPARWHIALVMSVVVLSAGPLLALGLRDVLRSEAHAEQQDLPSTLRPEPTHLVSPRILLVRVGILMLNQLLWMV